MLPGPPSTSGAPDSVTIAADGYEATVVHTGAALSRLRHDGVDLVRGTAPHEVISAGRGQILLPWPNRLRDGRYSFDGQDLQLALSEPARHNASHGLVRWCTWQLVQAGPAAAALAYRLAAQKGYPWTLDVLAVHRLSAAGLEVTLSATNRSSSPAPFAAGMHPYLDVGAALDDTRLTLPAATRLLVDDRMLPTGTAPVQGEHDLRAGGSLAGLTLDDGFTDLVRQDSGVDAGRVVVRLEGPRRSVELWVDGAWPWLQAYTGDDLGEEARTALAVEPMTAPADAFNSGTDLLVLDPGRTWEGRFGIRVG